MQKVIQVNVYDKKEDLNKEYELESLIKTAGGKVEVFISQIIDKPNPSFYIGKGKVFEIKDIAEKHDIKTAVFDVELSASQVRNLEETMKIKVVDWTTLILDIFASRARTKEARLKIHLAQLKYSLPRLNKWFSYLSRQAGGIGTRGPGETMLETDRRAVIRDIKFLEEKLKKLEVTKKVNRKSRQDSINVSLVGYTNAGKSTILNNMLKLYGNEKYVYSDDLLFATLDTATRRLTLDKKEITLTDTVGFIDNLSEELNESFLTTLEEIKFSDILLIVIDSSKKDIDLQIDTIDKALEKVKAKDKEMIYVFNKVDTLDDDLRLRAYKKYKNRIYISAKKTDDIIRLKDSILDIIKKDYVDVNLLIPYDKGDVISYFLDHYEVLENKYTDKGARISINISPIDYERYKQYIN
ncbi:MAG: GTPase HflX [Tissierellia bacterium]|nr:GTPase HflX [Tissierellia bacterium]